MVIDNSNSIIYKYHMTIEIGQMLTKEVLKHRYNKHNVEIKRTYKVSLHLTMRQIK